MNSNLPLNNLPFVFARIMILHNSAYFSCTVKDAVVPNQGPCEVPPAAQEGADHRCSSSFLRRCPCWPRGSCPGSAGTPQTERPDAPCAPAPPADAPPAPSSHLEGEGQSRRVGREARGEGERGGNEEWEKEKDIDETNFHALFQHKMMITT